MPVDTGIYGTLGQGSPMQSLNSMVTAANGVANLQAQQNQNVQTSIDAQETKNLQPVLRNTDAYMDAQGNIDFNKFVPMVMQVAPKNGAAIISHMAGTQQQKAQAQNAISTQSVQGRQAAAQAIYSIDPKTATPDSVMQTGQAIASNFNDPNAQQATLKTFQNIAQNFAATKPDDPLRATQIKHVAMMFQPIQEQQAINTPNGPMIDNGQQAAMINQKPMQGGVPEGGVVPGTMVQKQLPPSTQVMNGNTPSYLGPQMAGNTAGVNQPAGPVAAGLPVGASANIENNVNEMNRHFGSLQDAGANNQLAQSLTSNIKGLATKAITGTESDKLSYINGLLAQLPGHGHSDDIKKATDMLEKNMAQLNLSSPATTDAARKLVEAGRPNSHMSPEAVAEAADQVASQVQANTAIRNHLSGYKYGNNGQGDSNAYQAEREKVEKVADPRIWQYQSLQPGSKAAQDFMKKLPKSEVDPKNPNSLVNKYTAAQQMGLLSQ